MPAQKPCKGGKNRPGCGQAVVLAHAGAGVAVLEPYPVPAGHEVGRDRLVRVVVRDVGGGRTGMSVLAKGDPDQPGQRFYERHRCVTARNAAARPDRRPQQLGLELNTRPPDPGRL